MSSVTEAATSGEGKSGDGGKASERLAWHEHGPVCRPFPPGTRLQFKTKTCRGAQAWTEQLSGVHGVINIDIHLKCLLEVPST